MILGVEPLLLECKKCGGCHHPGFLCSDQPAKGERLGNSELPQTVLEAIKHYNFDFSSLQTIEPGLHWQVAEALFANGQGYKILPNLELFTGIDDFKVLVDKLINKNCTESILQNLDKFKEIDHQSLVEQLIRIGDGGLVAQYFYVFKGVDSSVVVDLLLEDENDFIVDNVIGLVRFIEFFVGVDHNKILENIIKKGYGGLIGQYLDNFTRADHNKVAQLFLDFDKKNFIHHLPFLRNLDKSFADWIIFESKRLYNVAENLSSFRELDTKIAEELINHNYTIHLIRDLARFNDLSIDIAKKLLAEDDGVNLEYLVLNSSSFSVEARDYIKEALSIPNEKANLEISKLITDSFDYLKPEWLRNIFLVLEDQFEYCSKENFSNFIALCVENRDYCVASGFVDVGREFGFPIDEGLIKEIEVGKNNQAIENRESFGDIYVTDELAIFYIYSMIELELQRIDIEYLGLQKNIDGKFRNTKEFSSVKARIDRGSIDSVRREHIYHIFEWLKQYLVGAVLGEMRHQGQTMDVIRRVGIGDVDELISRSTREDIRNRLREAQIRFEDPLWNEKFGGKRWSQIASVAREMWSDEDKLDFNKKSVLIDRVVDLQHNTGSVLNKDSRLKLAGLKQVLDIKKNIKTLEELWSELKEYVKNEDDQKRIELMTKKLKFLQTEVEKGHIKELGD